MSRGNRAPWRAGYMGHITQIGNILRITVDSRPEVAEHVQGNSHWQDYSTKDLEPRNEVGLLYLGIVLSAYPAFSLSSTTLRFSAYVQLCSTWAQVQYGPVQMLAAVLLAMLSSTGTRCWYT